MKIATYNFELYRFSLHVFLRHSVNNNMSQDVFSVLFNKTTVNKCQLVDIVIMCSLS